MTSSAEMIQQLRHQLNQADQAIKLSEARRQKVEDELVEEKNERLKVERENKEILQHYSSLEAQYSELTSELEHIKQGYGKEMNDCEAVLAEALGYPYDEKYGWVTGDHTITTLAMDARRKINELNDALHNYSGDDQWR